MALSLYPEAAYEEVFSVIAQGLGWQRNTGVAPTIAKSSVSAARHKLGAAPLQALHRRACIPLANPQQHPDAFYAGLRVVALDGSNFEVADEADNVAVFGYPGSRTGHAAYPQAQCAVLIECASHAILGASLGAYRRAEWALCEPLLTHLDATMLLLADRGFSGYAHWKAASDTGAQLLWRCANNRQLPVVEALPDGSYLSVIYPDTKSRRSGQGEIVLRVIEYSLPDKQGELARYRLLTTLLDPQAAPALELATLYHERWEVEGVFDELKTHLLGRRPAAQQDGRGSAPGVLWLGADALRSLLADAARSRRRAYRAAKAILYRARQSDTPQPAPFRGLPPQRDHDCENAGSTICCVRPPRCIVSAAAINRDRAWSSGDIRLAQDLPAPDLKAKRRTARQRCSSQCR